jgi:hypothetical protein
MPQVRRAQTNFAQGEFSPLMSSRRDLQLYRGGAARLLNRRPLSQGGTTTRPAFEYVANLPAAPAVLIPFAFRPDQRYVLALSGTRLDAWTANGTPCAPVTGCPWGADILTTLSWCVAGDTILLFHEAMGPQRIVRTGATTFSVSTLGFETPGFARLSNPATTVGASTTGTPGNLADLTASAPTWDATNIGEQIRWNGKRARITGYNGASGGTIIQVQWIDDASGVAVTATTEWQDQAWNVKYGYPSCGTVMDGRLWLAATAAQPSSLWASRVNAPFDFDVRNGDDADGIAALVGGIDTVPRIRHLGQQNRLLVMTDSGVWFIPSSDSRPVTPKTIAFRPVSEIGVSQVRPAQNDGALIYLDATRRVVREARWSDTLQSFTTDAVSLLSEHLIMEPVSSAGVLGNATQPGRLVVLANSDGTLAVQHSIASERVNAWVPWETDGIVHSVAGVERDLFLAVEREDVWVLERASDAIAPLDSVKRVTVGSATRSFTGFAHLASQTCGVVSKGHDLGDVVVSGDGSFTLGSDLPAVTTVDVGLRFDQVIRPMPIDADLPDGDAVGRQKRLVRVEVEVSGTGDFEVKGIPVTLGFQGDDYTTPPATFTGIKEVRVLGLSRECQFDITVETATRVTVLGLTREVQING